MIRREPHWRTLIGVLVVLTLIVNYIVLLSLGILSPSAAKDVAKTVTGTSFAVYCLWIVYDAWLWRFLQRLRIVRWPDLNGEWRGTGRFTNSSERKLEERPINVEVTLTIKQTSTRLWVDYEGKCVDEPDDETSSSAIGELERGDSDRLFVLRYTFKTQPGCTNPDNPGLAILGYTPGPPPRLKGNWVADPRKPASGVIDVKLVKTPSLIFPWREVDIQAQKAT
jgi:hypothetical protein